MHEFNIAEVEESNHSLFLIMNIRYQTQLFDIYNVYDNLSR